MASVHKHPGSRYWYCAFKDADGRRVYRTSRQVKRRNALHMAQAFEDAARKATAGLLTETIMRRIITRTMALIEGEPAIAHTIGAWFRSWASDKKLSRAPGTGKRYGYLVEDFLRHLGPKAKMDLCYLNKMDVQAYRDKKVKAGLSSATVNLAVKTIRTCLRLAIRQQLISVNPAEAVDLLPRSPKKRQPFTHDQVRKLIQTTVNIEWKGLIKVGYYVGARLGDCARLRFEDIDFQRGILTYVPRKQRRDQELKTLHVPIHPELLDYFMANRRSSGPVFRRLSRASISGCAGLSLKFRKLMDQAGIEYSCAFPKGRRGRRVYSLSFHSLRRSCNSHMANLGVSQEIRQRLIGHASEEVNDGYTTIEMATFQQAIGRLPPLESASSQNAALPSEPPLSGEEIV